MLNINLEEGIEEIPFLIREPPPDYVCKKVPVGCQENGTFLMDTRALKNPNDWKADDLGAFHHVGKVNLGYYEVTETGSRFLSKTKPSGKHDANVVHLKKTYWTHQKHKDFKRRCFEGYDNRGMRLPHVIVRYEFDGDPHPIKSQRHGNAKKSERCYYRSKPSTLVAIKEKVKARKGPSQVYDEVFEDAGGIIAFTSHGDLPKSRQQVTDVKRSLKSHKDKDQIAELIKMSRVEANDSAPFIRRVQVSPEPACLLANNRQLNDVVRFCTAHFLPPQILCIDTTFNVGNFYVTPTTYKHSLLVDRKYGKPPTLLGPTMVHMQKKAETYQYFSSSLVSLNADLSNVVAIGSDRDVALRKGFSSSFPIATMVYCKGHVEQDIRRKLRDLGVDQACERIFIDDIFGSEARKELGLIDSSCATDFDARLESFYPVWTKREMDARQLSSVDQAEFYWYFLSYVAQDMKDGMISSVREKVGLDDSFFFNNDPESMNNRIKMRMEKKKLTWPETVDQLKLMSEEQERNIERSIIGEGPFKVRPECQHLVVPGEKWMTMTKAQKERKIQAFHTMAVSEAFGVRSSCTTTSSQSSLFRAATEGMPSSSGKKPGQSRRRGGRRDISTPRDTTGYQPRVAGVDVPHPSESHYTCTWIKETRAFMCYGCDHPLRPKPTGLPSDVVPPAPFDVVLCRKELRMYKTREGALTFSVQPQNVYYHLKKSCVLAKNPTFSMEQLSVRLSGLQWKHAEQLRKEFGFTEVSIVEEAF